MLRKDALAIVERAVAALDVEVKRDRPDRDGFANLAQLKQARSMLQEARDWLSSGRPLPPQIYRGMGIGRMIIDSWWEEEDRRLSTLLISAERAYLFAEDGPADGGRGDDGR